MDGKLFIKGKGWKMVQKKIMVRKWFRKINGRKMDHKN